MNHSATPWLERHQIGLYLAALAVGALIAGAAPAAGRATAPLLTPVLATLLYATFVQVPVRELTHSLRNKRFLTAALVLNFAVVPLVVAGMWLFLPHHDTIRVGVLLVLLTPCIDYVIAFTQLAGGASHTLLAATPLLLLAQMLLLPVFLWLFLGPDATTMIHVGPFATAFVTLIAAPLALAWVTQTWAGRHRSGRAVTNSAQRCAVPLMAATLAIVVASQTPKLDGAVHLAVTVAPFFVVFLTVMAIIGWAAARTLKLDPAAGRALIFTGATRNSLVVLPLALALPDALSAAAIVVVTQTVVEIVGMIVYIAVVPKMMPTSASG